VASGSCCVSALTGLLSPVSLRTSTTIQHVAAIAFSVTSQVKRIQGGAGILNQLGIDYSLRPRLSTRLTLGGRTFPRNPWNLGEPDFNRLNRYLCLHSHFQALHGRLPLPLRCTWNAFLPPLSGSIASVHGLSPDHFRRNFARWVSCYALFK
jgi:hypothetical protein